MGLSLELLVLDVEQHKSWIFVDWFSLRIFYPPLYSFCLGHQHGQSQLNGLNFLKIFFTELNIVSFFDDLSKLGRGQQAF